MNHNNQSEKHPAVEKLDTLMFGLVSHLNSIEAYAHASVNGMNALAKAPEADRALLIDAVKGNLETIIASLREALASLAHQTDIEETRALRRPEEDSERE